MMAKFTPAILFLEIVQDTQIFRRMYRSSIFRNGSEVTHEQLPKIKSGVEFF